MIGARLAILRYFYYGGEKNNGNILSQTITVPSSKVGAYTAVQTYTSDSLNRTTHANEMIRGIQIWNQEFLYDRYGHGTPVNVSGIAADGSLMPRDGIANLAYDSTSNRITTAGFEYDAAVPEEFSPPVCRERRSHAVRRST